MERIWILQNCGEEIMNMISLWKKTQSEVSREELLAYTIGKIQPFEWVKSNMYSIDCLQTYPPIFYWRFHNGDEKIYMQIQQCVSEYRGNHQWVMYKGSDIGSPSKKNYTIEPMAFYEIHKTQGFVKLSEVMGSGYEEVCLKAIEDIPSLCKHIEDYFKISQQKPYLPIHPH